MPFNINTFKTNIEDFGYLKTSYFQVTITPPPILQDSANYNNNEAASINTIIQNISFRGDQIKIPGIVLNTVDINRYGVGPTQKMPISAQFDEISFSMISDDSGDIWQFWHNWAKGIFDFTGAAYASKGNPNRLATYTNEYRDNYATTIEIKIFDDYGNLAQTIDLYEAYPSAVRDVPFSWGDQNILKVNVNLTFKEYTIQGADIVPLAQQPQNDTLNTLVNLGAPATGTLVLSASGDTTITPNSITPAGQQFNNQFLDQINSGSPLP